VDPSTGAIGDVIIAADGQPIRRLADLTDQLEKKGVGQTIEISARRNGRTNIYRVQIADISR
jgi:2-alkenal reductase